MKKGLVLEGGAMRGMFTCGVIDVLMENGIEFDGTIGVSAGATFGCNIKSRQIGRPIRYNKRFMKDKRYCSFSNILKHGDMFPEDFCYKKLPEELDVYDWDAYKNNPMEFYCVVSDCVSGQPVYKKLVDCRGDEMKYLRASASMPLVSTPVEVDGKYFLDGGMTDSIPLKAFEELGYDRNIVVLTQPRNFVKEPAGGMGLIKLFLKKYPKLVEAMKNRHKVYNEEKEYVFQQEKNDKCLVICPKTSLGISRLEKNPEELERVYQMGRKAAETRITDIKNFLAGKKVKKMSKVDVYNSDYTKLNHAYIEIYEAYEKLIQCEDADDEVLAVMENILRAFNPALDRIKSEMTVKTRYKDGSGDAGAAGNEKTTETEKNGDSGVILHGHFGD